MGVGSWKTIITPLNKKKDPIVRATKSSFLVAIHAAIVSPIMLPAACARKGIMKCLNWNKSLVCSRDLIEELTAYFRLEMMVVLIEIISIFAILPIKATAKIGKKIKYNLFHSTISINSLM